MHPIILQEILSKYSDDIPVNVYRELVLSLAEALGNDGKQFALACGIITQPVGWLFVSV